MRTHPWTIGTHVLCAYPGSNIPVIAGFETQAQAEQAIEQIEQYDLTGVYEGNYFIDGPAED